MIRDENQEINYNEMKLYNDVMGIALSVWGNAGDCAVFQIMDKALDNFDLFEMECIKEGFDMLPEKMQRDIMSDIKMERTNAAIDRLSDNIATVVQARKERSA
jgi:hypothetical protein